MAMKRSNKQKCGSRVKTEKVVAEHGKQQKCVGGGFEEKIIEIKSR